MMSISLLFEVDKTCVDAMFKLPDKLRDLIANNAYRDIEIDKYFQYKSHGESTFSLGFHEPIHMCNPGVPVLIRQGFIPFAEDHNIKFNWYVGIKDLKHPIYGIPQGVQQTKLKLKLFYKELWQFLSTIRHESDII